MTVRKACTLFLALAALLVATQAASAQTLPATPGDFVINLDLAGAPTLDSTPSCSPDEIAIGAALVTGTPSVRTVCTVASGATQKTTTGTVANPTLAASTGDPGFNSGTIDALCDSTQTTDFALIVTLSGPTLQTLNGAAFYACSFTLAFSDAQQSTLVGTIEVNALIAKGDGEQDGSAIAVGLTGTVYVTSGTGAFEGAVGQGTIDQTQYIPLPPLGTSRSSSSLPAQACTATGCTTAQVRAACPAHPTCSTFAGRELHRRIATRANASTMQLKLRKGAGSARILVPAPPAGKRGAAAKVRASTKVKMAATTGAKCTVKASTGAVVGTKTATGKYGGISISPKAGSYVGATWIQATCTKAGGSFTSNKVKIKL